MSENNRSSTRYVEQIHEETQRYTRELLDDNTRLRNMLAHVRTENLTLATELQVLRDEVRQQRQERDIIARQLVGLSHESERFATDFARLEIQNANLANLYVASHQLHGTIDRDAVLQAIQEITANLIGSEEVAIFETSDDGTQLELAASFGIDKHAYARVPIGKGIIGDTAVSGTIYVSPTGTAGPEELTAVVPLMIEDRLVGAIAIFNLLSHKPGLNEIDREMFELLAMHAATSLYCARLHRNAQLLVVG